MKYPFKFLDSYDKKDNDIFFGRDAEIEALYKMSIESNVVCLHGPSGTGKTSLVQCGLARKFRSYEWLDIRILRGSNITQSLETALDQVMGNEISINEEIDKLFYGAEKSLTSEIGHQVTMLEKKIQGIYLQYFRPIYLIFDQFEELFILGEKDEYDKFLLTLKDLLKTEYPVKLIFVIREDYLGYLYELEKSIPGLMKNKLRIAPVDLGKTIEILTEIGESPVSLIKLEKDKEEEVVRRIFNKVKEKENSSTIQLPYLQVFLDKLYINITGDEENRQTEAVFTLDSLTRIDNIDNVLKDFLEDQVTAIANDPKKTHPSISTTVIWDVLSPFVSLEKTKKPISKEDLHARLYELKMPVVDGIVQALSDKRIVRYVPETALYELAHDALAERVAEKRNTQDIALLEKSTLITSQAKVYQHTGNAFSEDELALIEPFLSELEAKKMIDKAGSELISRSREKINEKKEAEKQQQIEEARKEAEKKVKEEQEELKRQLKEATYQKSIELQQQKTEFLKKAAKRRSILLLIVAIIITLFSVVTIYSQYRRTQAEEKEFENLYLSVASNLLRNDNPTLSYNVLKLGLKKNESDTLNSQLLEYERSGYIYLQGIYPALSAISTFNLAPNGVLTIDEEKTRSVWNTNSGLLSNSSSRSDSVESKSFPTTSKGMITVSLSRGQDSIVLRNEKGRILTRIPDDELYFSGLENVNFSENRRLLSSGLNLYSLSVDFNQPVPHKIPLLFENKKEIYPTVLSILNDTLVAVGYQNGNIVLYSLGKSKGKLRNIGVLRSSNDNLSENYRVVRMATDPQQRYLFVVNASNVINVWDRNKRDSTLSNPLQGHTGEINCLGFSADNTMMISGSADNTAIIWDISGKEMTKKSILKGPNSSSIDKVAFLNHDKDIVTVSNEGLIPKVYLWKNQRPSVLWEKKQVYQFSPFDFHIWGLTADSSTSIPTTDLYRNTLDYFLNLPATNEFPNDKSYSQIWGRSLNEAKKWYAQLKKRSDYDRVIAAYADKVLRKCSSGQSKIEQDIFTASEEMDEWKQFLSDTLKNRLPPRLVTRVSNRFSSYMERTIVNEEDGFRLINYYTDSVFKPLVHLYGSNRSLNNFKRNIDIVWCKYYLYTGQSDYALRVATELSRFESSVVDYRLYLAATLLVRDRDLDADSLYRSMQPRGGFKARETDRRLYALLSKLSEKNIASDKIQAFIDRFNLGM